MSEPSIPKISKGTSRPANASSTTTTSTGAGAPAEGGGGSEVGPLTVAPSPPAAVTSGKPVVNFTQPTATQSSAAAPAVPTKLKDYVYTEAHKTLKDNQLQIEFFSVSTGFAVAFPAFVKSFADTFNMEWASDSVYGRMDPIATYKNTKRVITCGFTIPGASEEEVVLNNRKFSKLLSLMYPNYDNAGTIISAPLFKVKYNNLISNAVNNADAVHKSGLLGYFTEFKYEPDNESNVFIKDGNIHYQSLNCTFTLTVLHTHRVGHDNNGVPLNASFPHLTTAQDGIFTSQINILKTF